MAPSGAVGVATGAVVGGPEAAGTQRRFARRVRGSDALARCRRCSGVAGICGQGGPSRAPMLTRPDGPSQVCHRGQARLKTRPPVFDHVPNSRPSAGAVPSSHPRSDGCVGLEIARRPAPGMSIRAAAGR